MKKIAFQKIDLVSFSKVFLGVALIILSVVILRSGQGESAIKTQKVGAIGPSDNPNYVTTWTASELLQMRVAADGTNDASYQNNILDLGVSAWSVNMKDYATNTDLYNETWLSPIAYDKLYDASNCDGGYMTKTSNIAGPGGSSPIYCLHQSNPTTKVYTKPADATKWLWSINNLADRKRINTIAFDSVSVTGLDTFRIASYAAGNGMTPLGAALFGNNRGLYVTASYGWSTNVIDSTNDSMTGAQGAMMPLKWTVYGKIAQ